MSTYVFKYFDGRGRGELSRLMFVLGGKKFEDVRIDGQFWSKEKSNTQFGWLPNFTVDGKMFSDSMAIAKYLAKQFGYYGKTELEQLEIDQVCGICYDFLCHFMSHFLERDETKKAKMYKTLMEETVHKYLPALEKIITANGGTYFVGKELTLADIAVHDVLYLRVDDDIMSKYPKVKASVARVAANDKIKAYIATRKHTTI